jgi:hypothetical protein
MTVRTRDPSGFREALLYVLELEERGLVVAISAHLDPTGIGRISFTTHNGADIDLAYLPGIVRDGEEDTDRG